MPARREKFAKKLFTPSCCWCGAGEREGWRGEEGMGGKVLPRSAVKRQLNVVAILKRRNLGVLGGGRGGKLRV